jgi:hypothetical protein
VAAVFCLTAIPAVAVGAAVHQVKVAAATADTSRHGTAALHGFRLPPQHGHSLTPNARDFAAPGKPGGPLLLFLPATGEQPSDYKNFLGTAHAVGYHVLGLDYWNRGRSVARTCESDPDCYTAVQRNRFDGSAPSRFSHVRPAGSILTRLQLALGYLTHRDPSAGWGRYLNHGDSDDGINWSHIVLAGHSQGGGESAYIAHRFEVQGVLMFSSPVETDHGVAASWMAASGATPSSRMYGLDDVHDVFFKRITGSWRVLGLGAFGRADHGAAPIPSARADSHELLSTFNLGTPVQAHGRTVNDSGPVTARGVPRFRAVWQWMLGKVYNAPAESAL